LASQLQYPEYEAASFELLEVGVTPMPHNQVARDWRELSEAASKETDPQKLLELVTELNAVLKQREDWKRDIPPLEPPSR
jgi:hypothetical protein